MSFTNKQSLLILHLIIFVWGFTGILGELIIMESIPLVFNRMLIAFISLYCFRLFFLKKKYISVIDKIKFAATGVLISIHWVFFFEAINIYNVSLAVTCLSSTSFFTSIIDPILKGKKIKAHEIILSLLVIFGILIIFISPEKTNMDFRNKAILLAVVSAFFASVFTTINSIFINKGHSSFYITKYEMLGGSIFTLLYLFLDKNIDSNIIPKGSDILYLMILGIVCTSLAYLISVEIMKKIKPFTMNISVNLEPIYAIILAILFFKDQEIMSVGFYIGGFIIIISIILNSFFKKHLKK